MGHFLASHHFFIDFDERKLNILRKQEIYFEKKKYGDVVLGHCFLWRQGIDGEP